MRTVGSWVLLLSLASLAVSAEAWSRSPDPARGERLYATCSACHGAAGMGQPEGPAPVLAGQHESVLLRQFADYRDSARWDPRMEHVARLRAFADRDDLADIAAFLSRLDGIEHLAVQVTVVLAGEARHAARAVTLPGRAMA